MLKIYHNPRCSKSRAGLEYIKNKGIEYEVIDYLKEPLGYKELKLLIQKLHLPPFDLVRTQEAVFKSEFKGKQFNDDEWIKIISEYPKLLQRPIVESGHKAVFAQPPEEIERLF